MRRPQRLAAITAALAKFDEASDSCPFNVKLNGPGRRPATSKPCPKCSATSSESCRVEVAAAFALIPEIREALR